MDSHLFNMYVSNCTAYYSEMCIVSCNYKTTCMYVSTLILNNSKRSNTSNSSVNFKILFLLYYTKYEIYIFKY